MGLDWQLREAKMNYYYDPSLVGGISLMSGFWISVAWLTSREAIFFLCFLLAYVGRPFCGSGKNEMLTRG